MIIPGQEMLVSETVYVDGVPAAPDSISAVLYRIVNGVRSASGVTVTASTTANTGEYTFAWTNNVGWNRTDDLELRVIPVIDSQAYPMTVWRSHGNVDAVMRGTDGANTIAPATPTNVTDARDAIQNRLGPPAGADIAADIATRASQSSLSALANKFTGITSVASWLGTLFGKSADAGTLTEIQSTTGGTTFDNTTDSPEAIGDAAFTLGTQAAANAQLFFANDDTATTKTVDDVGVASGGVDYEELATAIVAALPSGTLTVVRIGPQWDPKTKRITLIQGDDYLAVNGRAIEFALEVPGISLSGATATWRATRAGEEPVNGTATIVDPTGDALLRLEWGRSQLTGTPADYDWDAEIIDSGGLVATVFSGKLTLVESRTALVS